MVNTIIIDAALRTMRQVFSIAYSSSSYDCARGSAQRLWRRSHHNISYDATRTRTLHPAPQILTRDLIVTSPLYYPVYLS